MQDEDHFMFVLAGGLQGDNPDPDGDVSCNQAALSLLINSSLHTHILYLEFRPSRCRKKFKKCNLFAKIIPVFFPRLILISSLH